MATNKKNVSAVTMISDDLAHTLSDRVLTALNSIADEYGLRVNPSNVTARGNENAIRFTVGFACQSDAIDARGAPISAPVAAFCTRHGVNPANIRGTVGEYMLAAVTPRANKYPFKVVSLLTGDSEGWTPEKAREVFGS